MRTTIDAAGRIVIPKRMRTELGFGPGSELELSAVDDHLELGVPTAKVRLEERDGALVAVSDEPMPELTAEMVRETLERVRR